MPRLLLRDLLASGVEVPYEVRETGAGSPLAEYVPQTSAFIRDNAAQLAALDSYGTTCAAHRVRRPRNSLPRGDGRARAGRLPPPRRARGRRLPLPPLAGLDRLHARRRAPDRDDRRASRLRRGLASARSRSPSRFAAFRWRSKSSSSPARRSFAPTPSTCPPRLAAATEWAARPGSLPSWSSRASTRSAPRTTSSDVGIRAVAAFKRVVTTLRLFKAGGVALGPARLGQGRRRPLAADLDRRRQAAPRRLPPGRLRARRPLGALARARRITRRPSTA